MPKTVLKMFMDEERKERERSAKEEIRGLLYAKTAVKLKEQAALREKEITLTAKEKRDMKKQKKLIEKVESLPSSTVSEVQDFNIPGFKVVLEHMRRDTHCLLCPKLRVESTLLFEVDDGSDVDESGGSEEEESSAGDESEAGAENDTSTAVAHKEDVLVAKLLPIIACQDNIEHTDIVIRFILDVRNGQAQQAFVLTIPRFYYPDGLTKDFIDQKIREAVGRVFAEDEEVLKSMSVISNKVSIGHKEGWVLGKELAANYRAKVQQSYLHQQAQMHAVGRSKEERKWKRILTTTGAAREKSQDISALAERDVAILRGELRGKHTMKSSKGLHEKAVHIADGEAVEK
jgi:hypothetical protein